jgi:hypothetical protein
MAIIKAASGSMALGSEESGDQPGSSDRRAGPKTF